MVTLVHHWLVTNRGGESVLAEVRRLFPDAPLGCLVVRRGEVPNWVIGENVITSSLQLIPCAGDFYKRMLPLYPWAISRLRVPDETKLVLSSDAAMIKGLRVPRAAVHCCYCHSPPRYLWDRQGDYINQGNRAGKFLFGVLAWWLRRFDYRAAQRVSYFIANSNFVAERIRKFYGRDSTVIYPPVNVTDFDWQQSSEEFYLLVSQLVPYKRADLAIEAFNRLGKRLVVIGAGTELERLRKMAGPTVTLFGRQPFPEVKRHFERCRAFIYPQVEDFGITAVEAQAAGKPVIAFREGGALESVVEGTTGLFFDQQTPESLVDAVRRFEMRTWSAEACRRNAERFSPERFRDQIWAFLQERCPEVMKDQVRPSEEVLPC